MDRLQNRVIPSTRRTPVRVRASVPKCRASRGAVSAAIPRRRNTERPGESGGGEAERFHEVVLEDFAGVDGIKSGHGGGSVAGGAT